MPKTITLRERVLSKTKPVQSGCWEWTSTIDRYSYGRITVDGRQRTAHHVAYEQLVGPIPDWLEIDHLCQNRACVNPSHLEPVPHAENMDRAFPPLTHCKAGHDLSTQDLVPLKGRRPQCRICHNARRRRPRAQ